MLKISKTLSFLTVAIAVATTAPSGRLFGQTPATPTGLLRVKEPISNQYIVVLKEQEKSLNAPVPDTAATARELTGLYNGALGFTYENALHGFSVTMPESRALALASDPRVAFVEEDSKVSATTTQVVPPSAWGLDRIDQHQGRNLNYDYVYTGAGVHAYVIDTGILPTHWDFGGRASIAADFVNDGQNGYDCDGHGTHVAGIIGGATYGVAKEVTLHAVRVLNCGGFGGTSAVIAGVDWVTAHKTLPAVANMSLGIEPDPGLDAAVRNSIAQGITYVVSAGNDNVDAGLKSPARVAEAITVAATGLRAAPGTTTYVDVRLDVSNFGPSVDIFAPGGDIESDWKDGSTAIRGGTSQASPHVAGVAALYLQTHPSATPATVSNAIKNAATQNVVQNPGPGSPNALLYVRFPPATVTITGQEQHACRIESDTAECIGIVFDSGTVTVTVNGRSYTTTYGKLSLAKNIASALAASINTDPDVSASASGTVISILSRFGCYTLSADSRTSLPQFFDPSFSGTVSGPVCP